MIQLEDSDDGIQGHSGKADRNQPFPPEAHQLIVAEAGQGGAQPDDEINEYRQLEEEPEQA